MRVVFFCSIAFAVNAAVASVCKPRPRSSDTSALLSTSTTQDVTTTTLLAVPSVSASAPVSSDAAFTSLSERTVTTSDLLLPTTIGTEEETSATTGTASGSEAIATSTLIDAATTDLFTVTAETVTSQGNAVTAETSQLTLVVSGSATIEAVTSTEASATTPTTETTTIELSSTTLSETTSTEASATVDTTTATLSSTASETTTVGSGTTGTGTTTELSTTEEETTTFRVTTTAMETTTTGVPTTEAETTTTADFTTTTSQSPFQPLPTFDLVGIGSPINSINGQRVSGLQSEGNYIGWDRAPAEPVLHFILEPETGYLKASESSLYMCVFVASEDPLFYNRVFICSEDMDDFQVYGRITCDQTSDGKLACSAPATSCVLNQNTFEFECTDLGREFDTFYSAAHYNLLGLISFGYKDEPPVGTEVHPVELGIVAPMPDS